MKGPPSPPADFVPDQTWIIWPLKETIEPDRPASIGQVPDTAGTIGVPLPITFDPLLLVPEPPPEPVLLPAVELPELLLPLPPPTLPEFDEPLLGRVLDPDPVDPDADPDPGADWPVELPVPEDDPLLGVVVPPSGPSIEGVTSPAAQPAAAATRSSD